MKKLTVLLLGLFITTSATGCLAIGNGSGGEATMADEIRELEDLRDDGLINQHQYQAGVNKLLYSYAPAPVPNISAPPGY